ncbi:MAG TPA: AAA family ATPase [Longimicrobiales bacterium]|nr:AAA family ATPase [Longimicrobiales bacterium]
MRSRPRSTFGTPFLTGIELHADRTVPDTFPFDLSFLRNGLNLRITTPVTFFVGENGSGKSTLLEALAWGAGFGSKGGNRDHRYPEDDEGRDLGRALRLSWRLKVHDGFFMRAETFFNFASYLESVGSTFRAYGGQSLNEQSHGEAFLAVFRNRFENGLYLLDEPEAALSPQRQLAFLGILHELTRSGIAQFIIATHSPILMAFPGATILSFDGEALEPIAYRDTEHFRITRDFLEAPERFFRHLLDPDAAE